MATCTWDFNSILNYDRVKRANCDGITPCVPLGQANTKYQKRCKSKGLTDECAKICKYDIDKDTVFI